MPEISVVIPVLDEEENVEPIAAAVAAALRGCVESYEIIFIDNGSTDRSRALLRQICARDPAVRAIFNTRNFGQMRSPTHGIYQATGRAVIGMCADFQDSPELLPEFVRRWRAGALIVLGVREAERATPVLQLLRRAGYGFMARFGDYPVIPGATGFGLYDRKVVETLARWNEPEPFFRGMLVETGYQLETIKYQRPERRSGRSKNDLAALFGFFVSGLASSSKSLLRLPLFLGLLAGLAGCGLLLIGFAVAMAGGAGLAWLGAALLAWGFAATWTFLGLLGEQVRLISERARGMPLVVEQERINLPGPEAAA